MQFTSAHESRLASLVTGVLFLVFCAAVAQWVLTLMSGRGVNIGGDARHAQTEPMLSGALPLLFGGTRTAQQAGDIQVIGVVAPRGAGAGVAVLSISGRPPTSVREGAQIGPGVRLLEVLPYGVVLERNGRREEARLPQKPVAGSVSGQNGEQMSGSDSEQAIGVAGGLAAGSESGGRFSPPPTALGMPSAGGSLPTTLSPANLPVIVNDPD